MESAFLIGIGASIPLTAATICWETWLARRTVRTVNARSDALEAEVRGTVAKAEADRDSIKREISATRRELTDLVERGTAERIAKARDQIESDLAQARADLDAQVQMLAQREAELAAREAELVQRAQMKEKSALGVEARAEKAAAIDALLAEIELRFGAGAVEIAQQHKKTLETAAKWRGTPVGDAAMRGLMHVLGGGTAPKDSSSSKSTGYVY